MTQSYMFKMEVENNQNEKEKEEPNKNVFWKDRTVYLSGEINDKAASMIIGQLRCLSYQSKEDVILIINSPGGYISSGMAIYDCMKSALRCDVVTVGMGMAASMGAILLSAGTKGKRYATENTDIMIHQPLGGSWGQSTDVTLEADHLRKHKDRLAAMMAEACGKTKEELARDMDRNFWMTSEEALEYGLIDHVGFPSEAITASEDEAPQESGKQAPQESPAETIGAVAEAASPGLQE